MSYARRLRFESLEVRRYLHGDHPAPSPGDVAAVADDGVVIADVPCDLNNPACVASLQPSQYRELSNTQVRLLTETQIRGIQGWMLAPDWWPNQSYRSTTPLTTGFSPMQIGWLNVAFNSTPNIHVPLVRLDDAQRAFLTSDQIATLAYSDFTLLPAPQVRHLRQHQIGPLTDSQFENWQATRRAGLTAEQIPWLDMSNGKMFRLTPEQREWLTPAQIETLPINMLKYVPAALVQHILPDTLAEIHDRTVLGDWKFVNLAGFSAMTLEQVQALDLSDTQFVFLTTQQQLWISDSQLAMLKFNEYRNDALQIFLTPEQISRVPASVFASFKDVNLRALTPQQQVGLTREQLLRVATGTPGDFDQDGAIDGDDLLKKWRPNFALATGATIAHGDANGDGAVDGADVLLWQRNNGSKPAAEIWDLFVYTETTQRAPIGSYLPTVDVPLGPDGLADTSSAHNDAHAMFDLVPAGFQTHTVMADGDWTNPEIWSDNAVPGAGAKVLIPANRTVRYDANSPAALSLMRVDGTLKFAHDADTLLVIDTIVVDTYGKFHMGTETQPIGDQFTARIEFPVDTPIDYLWDPSLVSRGLLSRGQVRMFGKTVTPFLPFAPGMQPSAGTTQLVLAEAPTNWAVGDRLVLAGTNINRPDYGVEERYIVAISGNVVTVDPLQFDHKPPAGYDFPVHVANVERNIVLRAQTSQPLAGPPSRLPHIFFLHNWDVHIENIHVVGMGRTDKTTRIVEPTERPPGDPSVNARGRYALHFHHTSVNPDLPPRIVRGSSLEDGPGWGYVNHQSYVIMENNFAHNFDGASFVTEDGNEIGAFIGNLSIGNAGPPNPVSIDVRERADIHDFGHTGNGYWLQGPGVELTDNIANATAGPAFAIFAASNKVLFDAVNLDDPALAFGLKAIPVEAAPLKGFARNTSYGVIGSWDMWYVNPSLPGAPFAIDGFTSWNQRTAGVALHYVNDVTLRNATVVGNLDYPLPGASQPTRIGVFLNSGMENTTIEDSQFVGFDVGAYTTYRFATTIRRTTIAAVDGIHVPESQPSASRIIRVEPSVQFATLTPADLKGRTQLYYTMDGTFQAPNANGDIDYRHLTYEAVVTPIDIIVQLPNVGQVRLYYTQQRGIL